MDSLFLQQKFQGLLFRSKFDFVFHNVFVFDKESDIFACKDGFIYEYEFKVGKSDFRKDINKKRHLNENIPNYFFYVVSSADIIVGDIIEYAGIYVHSFQKDGLSRFKLLKPASKLTDTPISYSQLYSLLKKKRNG